MHVFGFPWRGWKRISSLRKADVCPRSLPLRDVSRRVPPRETSLTGDERGQTSAVRRLTNWHLKKIGPIFFSIYLLNYLVNISLTACSLAPMYLLSNSGPLMLMKLSPHSLATTPANIVFPVPGGP